ncbi:SEC-C domain-containing protein [Metabacillus sediminilitoris]|uniref:SEC-C domain-containing protein n=1 Tax=Metabacillus sediminilitoris TaxID=2567941 RepID=A0A4S4C1C0_9BACI|nr:hypothetical protein GMB29_24795 [Metabacillus sediminilitoris]THF81443.1 SEC-C domain-containing protein [Metabacillus sediminilitoris]
MINLEIKRNDPCPCGSGKKYKKCCLVKENVIQIQEVKEDRFLQNKHKLVIKLKDFLSKKIPRVQYYQLEAEFKNRSQHTLDEMLNSGLFDFYLFFFHRFENGLRGIEMFMNETESQLPQEEKQMANTWLTLSPKLVQAINKENETILFEDVLTKEQYQVADSRDNLPTFAPWIGTIALLEPFDDLYYFNGVKIFQDPNGVFRAVKKVEELMQNAKLTREQVLFDYLPEILASLLVDEENDKQTREILEYTLQYTVQDQQVLSQFIHGQEHFTIDTWDQENKACSWAGNWYQYTDNEISEPIFLAEVYGKLFVENDLLTFISLDEKRLEEFKQIIDPLIDCLALTNLDEKTKSFTIPFYAEIRDMMFSLGKDIPQYFALYAQGDIRFEFDKPIRQFKGLTIKELIESGRIADAENWLKQIEFNLYQQVRQQYQHVDITADFNTVRKELGLPLSPFVTGGDKRISTFEQITKQNQQAAPRVEIDPDYEQLGFTIESINSFYAEDMVAFFKEKTAGKSENTVRKYRNSLQDLVIIFDMYDMTNWSWDSLDYTFWEKTYVLDFLSLYEVISKTAIKDFLSTTKALAKWLDQKKKSTSLTKVVTQATKEVEEPMLHQLV